LPGVSDRSDRCVFGLVLALAGGGIGLVTATIVATLASVHHAPARSGQIVLAGVHFTYPTANGAGALLLALGGIGAGALALAVLGGWRQLQAYRRFACVLNTAQTLERDPRVGVIPDLRPQAFCAGYVRPAVYVSRGAVELLTDDELDAVLAHEHHHRRARDPLRIACGRILCQALFFVPAIRSLSDRYADLAELRADRAAVLASEAGEAPLASALLAFDESAVPGVSGISPERVDSLLGEPTRWCLPAWSLAGSVSGPAALVAATWLVSESASTWASLNVPILSSRPCVALVSLLPLAVTLTILARRRHRSAR